MDSASKASSVEYFQDDKLFRAAVPRCGGLLFGYPRAHGFLFNSATKLFPRGLGNNHDWVGRNAARPRVFRGIRIVREGPLRRLGTGGARGMLRFSHGLPDGPQRRRGDRERVHPASLFICALGSTASSSLGDRAQAFCPGRTTSGPWECRVRYKRCRFLKAAWNWRRDLKDHWGIPSLRISGQRHAHDVEVGIHRGKCEEWLKEAGAVTTWKSVPGRGVSGGQHQAGTCRMGNDPKTSVVDRHCRIPRSR